jgi:hypothetical protein
MLYSYLDDFDTVLLPLLPPPPPLLPPPPPQALMKENSHNRKTERIIRRANVFMF